MTMKTKGVAFNLDDPHQKELYEYACSQTNYSSYIKRLIDHDMTQKHTKKPVTIQPSKPSIYEIAKEKKALKA